jgi:hypothetical protein
MSHDATTAVVSNLSPLSYHSKSVGFELTHSALILQTGVCHLDVSPFCPFLFSNIWHFSALCSWMTLMDNTLDLI